MGQNLRIDNMKQLFLKLGVVITLVLASCSIAKAQSNVMEITWNMGNVPYKGLMVIYPNNTGKFVVNYWNYNLQTYVRVMQDVRVNYQYDLYGNYTTFLNCYYPKTYPSSPYSADNFIIYPNGAMYTQDYAGAWSTAIIAQGISPNLWQSKFREYGLQ